MKSVAIRFKAGTIIELSFATIIEGRENRVFGEYFPKVLPIVADLGGTSLCSFSITGSAANLGTPKMGALFEWPSMDAFRRLHKDPRFLAIRNIRDNALSFFSNGHFFAAKQDSIVTFEEGESYALHTDWESDGNREPSALLKLHAAVPISVEKYQPAVAHISLWNDSAELELSNAQSGVLTKRDLFKCELNFPAQDRLAPVGRR